MPNETALIEGQWHLRDLRSATAAALGAAWWRELLQWREEHVRDQLSFGFAAWRLGLLPGQNAAAGVQYAARAEKVFTETPTEDAAVSGLIFRTFFSSTNVLHQHNHKSQGAVQAHSGGLTADWVLDRVGDSVKGRRPLKGGDVCNGALFGLRNLPILNHIKTILSNSSTSKSARQDVNLYELIAES